MKMNKKFSQTFNDPTIKSLYQAISLIKTRDEAEAFFEDLCTPTELQAMADRFQVVGFVKAGKSYREIYAETKISVTTIGRVARTLLLGKGGYHLIYNRFLKFIKKPLLKSK